MTGPAGLEQPMTDVTTILIAAGDGDSGAASQLLPLVYDDLRQLAAAKMANEQGGQTLDATALVHEAFLRLVKEDDLPKWDTRGHFFAAAAEAMRRILVEIARRKGRIKHGGGRKRLDLDTLAVECKTDNRDWADDLLELDETLTEFSKQHEVAAQLVKLRYFAGLTMEDAARTLNISRRTSQRHWAFAKAWLYERLSAS